MQTITQPEAGKIYCSTTPPGFVVQIVSVETHSSDDFVVHVIDKSEGGNNQQIDLLGVEWMHGNFTTVHGQPQTNMQKG